MLHYETHGDSPETIVFLHGIGGTLRYWKRRVLPLASSYRLILVDLLGYGQSPKPWTKYTVERHVEELHQVLHEQESLTIVGHSFGSIIALAFAARYPHKVKGLVLISLPYFGYKAGTFRYFRNSNLADRYVMTNIGFAALACVMTRYVLRWLLPYVLRDMPREVVQSYTTHMALLHLFCMGWHSIVIIFWMTSHNSMLIAIFFFCMANWMKPHPYPVLIN